MSNMSSLVTSPPAPHPTPLTPILIEPTISSAATRLLPCFRRHIHPCDVMASAAAAAAAAAAAPTLLHAAPAGSAASWRTKQCALGFF